MSWAGCSVSTQQEVALGHEQRHLHDEAGLERGRLLRAGGRVAGEAGIGLGHLQVDGHRQLDAQHLALVRVVEDVGVLLEVARVVAERGGRHRELLVGLGIHEVVRVAIGVEVLRLAGLDARPRPAGAGLEGALDDVALAHVLHLHADLRRAASHLDVAPVEDLHELAVELDDDALLDVAGADQSLLLLVGPMRCGAPQDTVCPLDA